MAFSWNPFNRWSSQKPEEQTAESALNRNQNYQIFKNVSNDIERIVASRSIVGKQSVEQQVYANPIWQTFGVDGDMLMMPVATNKQDRILQYRRIAKYPEADWCLDEIADEFIHEDENGNFINLKLPDGKNNLNETRKDILQEEFRRYINLFRLRDEGYNLIKRFLVEGELAWENVIKTDVPSMGIVGVRFLMPEYYETLIDTKTNKPVGLLFDVKRFATDTREILMSNYLGSSPIFNAVIPTTAAFNVDMQTSIPFLWSQVTYISSGEISLDGNQYISLPLIDKTKQAYQQLALLQEAAVILRVTRAPERLLFNISTGKMNDNYAKAYVHDFANSLKSKKVAQPGQGRNGQGPDIGSVYNPVSMLESYVFSKSDGNDGTSIESVGSQANYEELGDIEYFLRRFMKQFKVPFSRYKTPENAQTAPDQLSAEDHAFLRMIVRYQRRFALGFKDGYIVNLKLKGIWEKYGLKDEDIDIQFVKPDLYNLYEVSQIMETKMTIYKNALGDNEEFAPELAMKKFLGFTDADIEENYKYLIKSKMMAELRDFYGSQVAEHKGLAGWEPPIKYKDQEDKEINQESETANKEDESDEDNSEDTGSEDSSDTSSDDTSDSEDSSTEASAPAEPSEPTFGLS